MAGWRRQRRVSPPSLPQPRRVSARPRPLSRIPGAGVPNYGHLAVAVVVVVAGGRPPLSSRGLGGRGWQAPWPRSARPPRTAPSALAPTARGTASPASRVTGGTGPSGHGHTRPLDTQVSGMGGWGGLCYPGVGPSPRVIWLLCAWARCGTPPQHSPGGLGGERRLCPPRCPITPWTVFQAFSLPSPFVPLPTSPVTPVSLLSPGPPCPQLPLPRRVLSHAPQTILAALMSSARLCPRPLVSPAGPHFPVQPQSPPVPPPTIPPRLSWPSCVPSLLIHSSAVPRSSSAPRLSQCPQVPPDPSVPPATPRPPPQTTQYNPYPWGPQFPPSVPKPPVPPATPSPPAMSPGSPPPLPRQCPSPWAQCLHTPVPGSPPDARRVPGHRVPLQPGHLGARPG